MTETPLLVTLRYYAEDDGSFSADSPQLPGWTVLAPDLETLRGLAREGLDFFIESRTVVIVREFLDGRALYEGVRNGAATVTFSGEFVLTTPGVNGVETDRVEVPAHLVSQ